MTIKEQTNLLTNVIASLQGLKNAIGGIGTDNTTKAGNGKKIIFLKQLKYDSKCFNCGVRLRKEYGGYYAPDSKKIYCKKCSLSLQK